MSALKIFTTIAFVICGAILNTSAKKDGTECSQQVIQEAAMQCVMPQVMDYNMNDPAAALQKFIEDDLSIPCKKVQAMIGCFKKSFPQCSLSVALTEAGGSSMAISPQILPKMDEAVDVAIKNICEDNYNVFNDAKNCLIAKGQLIVSNIYSTCQIPQYSINDQFQCDTLEKPEMQCAKRQVATACGQPFVNALVDLEKKLKKAVLNCGAPTVAENIAFKKKTAQSSTWDGSTDSSKAVDGNANSDYYAAKSCMHTLYDVNAWWAVDLGCISRIDEVIITNRGDNGLGHRLHDFNVGVSDSDPKVTAPRPSNYKLCATFKGPAKDGATLPFHCNEDASVGRYVIVQMPQGKGYLHICEVVVHGKCLKPEINIALNKKTSQSSTHAATGVSSKAVDGNANPEYSAGSCSHTGKDSNAWWAVDLGSSALINKVTITNRGDNSLGSRLHDFNVGVSNMDPTVTSPRPSNYDLCASFKGPAGDGARLSFTCPKGTDGRFVIVQMPGETKQFLHICEVEVDGKFQNDSESNLTKLLQFLRR